MNQPSPVTRQTLPAQPFFNSPAQRVALARERCFERGERPSGLVSEAVLQSWMRCLGERRDPAQAVAFDPVSRARIHATLERNRDLLRAAQAPLAQLERALAGSGCRVLLTDEAGVQVRAPSGVIDDDEPVLRCAARVGVSLDERQVGTNAPGVVLKTRTPIVVSGAEHFFFNTGVLHCAAAPIGNGRDRLAGVLDLTIEGRPFGFDAAALVALYATLIENDLLLARSRDALVLRFQVCPSLLEGSMQALVGIDEHGRMAWCNGVARRLLGLVAGHGGEIEPLLGCTVRTLLARHGRPPQPLALPNGLTVWVQAAAPMRCAPARVPERASSPPPAASAVEPAAGGDHDHPDRREEAERRTLDQHTRQTIHRVVDECGGNLSAAARRLGVSRGLLYRRLRA